MTYRYNSGVGSKTGFTDNSGLSYDITSYVLSNTSGTVSISPMKNKTFIDIPNSPTGNINISINAINNQVFDELSILIGSSSLTYSLAYFGSISSNPIISNTVYTINTTFTASIPGTSSLASGTITSTYSNVMYSTGFTIPVGSTIIYNGVYDGTKFRGNTNIQTS